MKPILLTFSATITALGLAGTLFLNTILGTFGMAATTIEELADLRASHQVVDRMKIRHQQRKHKISKTIARRSAKRVASTALAAATIGMVAVVVTMTTLEVADYCDEKRILREEADILYGTDTGFDLERCIEEGGEDTKAILAELKDSSTEAVSDAMNSATRYGGEKWAAIKTAGVEALDSMGEASGELWDAARMWVVE